MDKLIEQSLHALLAREGLQPKEGDLEEFAKIIELYMGNLKTLHSVDLGAEEVAGVFRPEWTAKLQQAYRGEAGFTAEAQSAQRFSFQKLSPPRPPRS